MNHVSFWLLKVFYWQMLKLNLHLWKFNKYRMSAFCWKLLQMTYLRHESVSVLVTDAAVLCDWQRDLDPPHLAAYTSYIDHEITEGDPVRVFSIFERAIVDNCLQPDLWSRYIRYVVCVCVVWYSAHCMYGLLKFTSNYICVRAAVLNCLNCHLRCLR